METADNREQEERRRRDLIAAWHASGQSLQVWSEQTGQSYWQLRRWRLKYAEELGIVITRRAPRAEQLKKPGGRSSSLAVVPVEIAAPIAPSKASASTAEIRLRGARALIVATTIEAMTLTRLISAIPRQGERHRFGAPCVGRAALHNVARPEEAVALLLCELPLANG